MVQNGSNSITLLGAGASFEGKITSPHVVQVYGKFSGEIHASDLVAIGRDGIVIANINAKSVLVEGKIQGNLNCKEQVELQEHSEVRGNITAKELIIKKGAVFHGNSSMLPNAESKNDRQNSSSAVSNEHAK
jgi:cytoskeletal protein CcmA (bactofilin family)